MPENTFTEKLELKKVSLRKKQSSNEKKKYVSVPIKSFKNSSYDLYQKTCQCAKVDTEIDLLTSLVLSDEDDISHLELVKNDFANGVLNPFSDDLLDCLLDNKKLISDICG